MFLLILGALVAFTVIIMFAASMIGGPLQEEIQAGDPMQRAAIEKRIAPVGQVAVAAADQGAGAGSAAARSGAEVYQAVCLACHASGAAGAPKVGDKAAWEPRVGAGMDALVQTAISGKGAMPPRGGQPATTDEEIRAAVAHMLQETGLEAAGGAAPAAAAASAVSEAADTVVAAVAGAVEATAAAVSEAVAPAGDAGVDLAKGKEIYQGACFACHGTGAAGAPKLGDTADWAPRIAQGSETLLQHAINGYQGQKGVMPPKGGRVDLSDADVTAAIAYMVSESQ
jgi:cytochrome c5